VATDPRPVYTYLLSYASTLKESLDPNVHIIMEKTVGNSNFDENFASALDSKVIMVESRRFLDFNIRKSFVDRLINCTYCYY